MQIKVRILMSTHDSTNKLGLCWEKILTLKVNNICKRCHIKIIAVQNTRRGLWPLLNEGRMKILLLQIIWPHTIVYYNKVTKEAY